MKAVSPISGLLARRGWLVALCQIASRVDQAQVRERLREIPELTAGNGVVFLSQEAHVVANG
jgi:hypothetical protein